MIPVDTLDDDASRSIREEVLYCIHDGRDTDAIIQLEGLLTNASRPPDWLDLTWYLQLLDRQGEHYEIVRLVRRWNDCCHVNNDDNQTSSLVLEAWLRINWSLLKAALVLPEEFSREEVLNVVAELQTQLPLYNSRHEEGNSSDDGGKLSSPGRDYPPGYYQPLRGELLAVSLERLKEQVQRTELGWREIIQQDYTLQFKHQHNTRELSSSCLPAIKQSEALRRAIHHFQLEQYHQCIESLRHIQPKSTSTKSFFVIPLWARELWAVALFCLGRVEELEYWAMALQQESPESPLALYLAGLWHQLCAQNEIDCATGARNNRTKESSLNGADSVYTANPHTSTVDHLELARRNLSRAAEAAPLHTGYWLALGHHQAAVGEHELALAAYNHVLTAISPNHPDALLSLAAEWLRVREGGRAAPLLRDLQERYADCPRTLNELGVLFWQRSEWNKAEEAFYHALKYAKMSSNQSMHQSGSVNQQQYHMMQTITANYLRVRLLLACRGANVDFFMKIITKELASSSPGLGCENTSHFTFDRWPFGMELRAIFDHQLIPKALSLYGARPSANLRRMAEACQKC